MNTDLTEAQLRIDAIERRERGDRGDLSALKVGVVARDVFALA